MQRRLIAVHVHEGCYFFVYTDQFTTCV